MEQYSKICRQMYYKIIKFIYLIYLLWSTLFFCRMNINIHFLSQHQNHNLTAVRSVLYFIESFFAGWLKLHCVIKHIEADILSLWHCASFRDWQPEVLLINQEIIWKWKEGWGPSGGQERNPHLPVHEEGTVGDFRFWLWKETPA